MPLRTPSLHQLKCDFPRPIQPSRQEPKPASLRVRGFPSVEIFPNYLLSENCEGKQKTKTQFSVFNCCQGGTRWLCKLIRRGGHGGPRKTPELVGRSAAARWTEAFRHLHQSDDLSLDLLQLQVSLKV